MEEYTSETANKLRSCIGAYNYNQISKYQLFVEAAPLLKNSFNDYCTRLQQRIDSGLCATIVTKDLIYQMRLFLKVDDKRFIYEEKADERLDDLNCFIDLWVSTYEKYFGSSEHPSKIQKPQQITQQTPPETKIALTERAKTYFNKAISLGYLETTETGYKSRFRSKALLAYFLEWVFCKDENGKDNGQPFPETEVNNLFDETRLGKARGQCINNKNGKPTGYKIIDELFK